MTDLLGSCGRCATRIGESGGDIEAIGLPGWPLRRPRDRVPASKMPASDCHVRGAAMVWESPSPYACCLTPVAGGDGPCP